MTETLPPLHPGEVLREEFLVPLGLTAGEVARAIDVPRTRIERIVSEQTGISADTAIRLGQLFGTTPQFWMNAQAGFDLAIAQAAIGNAAGSIKRIQPAREHDPQAGAPPRSSRRKVGAVT